jgi:phosphate transport system permease protein
MTDEPLSPVPTESLIPPGDEPKQPVSQHGPGEKDGFIFSQGSLKKKLRLSEILSEKIITGVAFLSITIIILIFVFVFKETLPIFRPVAEHKAESALSGSQEKYNGTESTAEEPKQERYTGSEEPKQERYGVGEDTTGSAAKTAEEVKEEDMLSGRSDRVVPFSPDRVTLKGLFGKVWMPVSDVPRYGMVPLIIGTIKITLIGILFAAPLAILAALFSAAFSPKWLKEYIKPAIEILAGFPSVVVGFFALMVMATFLQEVFGYSTRLNAFVGGIAMALAAIPIIFTITEDVMTAVPETYKEASLALGASRWQTAFYVTLPAATPGIFAAVLLGIGRIFGETMIALMATGNAALNSLNPFESVRTLSATIGAEMAEVVFGDTHYNVLFLIGSLLFVFTFSLNALAEFYVKGRLMRRFQGRIS